MNNLYISNQLLCYNEIEEDRKNNKKYVFYEYYKLDSRCVDEYSTDYGWSKYFVFTKNTSRNEIYEEAFIRHNLNKDPLKNYNKMENLLKEKGFGTQIIDEFKRLSGVNGKDTIACELMIMAGATIDFDLLINDISKCSYLNKNQISQILNTLAEQVNCAAFNGVFTKIFKNAYRLSGSEKPIKEYEDKIENLYNALLFGSNLTKPINIPMAFQKFEIIEILDKIVNQYDDLDTADVATIINSYYDAAKKTLAENRL